MSTSASGRLRSWRPADLLVLVSAAVALVCALAFPFAPVHQPTVDYAWPGPTTPAGPSTTAVGLMPYQPVRLRAAVSCDALRSVPVGAAVLATTPATTPDGPLGGLRVVRTPVGAAVTSNGVGLADVALPPGPCDVAVASAPSSTQVSVDGRTVADVPRDVRPVVAAVVSAAPSTAGITLDLRTDTRFQTTPSVLKIVLGALVLLGLVGMITGALLGDGVRRRWPARPRVVDVVVGVGLAAWAVIGPATVDDGYIAGILRSRGENGFVGNVSRWLNAPEAPFSWFYEVDHGWAALAPGPAASVLWLRVPATVLGVLCWLVVSRHVLPRLGPALRRPSAPWIAALVFAAWWLPFGLSLRPEPWVATGAVAVWVATERAVATRRLLPLLAAALLGGLTVALTPGALGGLVPLLVAVPALVRAGGGRAVVRVATVIGAGAVAVLPMAADQSLGAILESTRVREVIGGGQPWYEELDRYNELLTPGDVQGGLAARLPVLLMLLAVPALAWVLRDGRAGRVGVAAGPSGRLLATVAVTLVLLTLSPTKWTLHFGTFAGIGTAAVTLLVVVLSPRALRALRTGPRAPGPYVVLGLLAAVVLVAGLVLAGHNQWAYASTWGVFWDDISPQIHRIELSGVVLYVGLVVVVVAAVVLAARRARRAPAWIAPGPVALALTVLVLALVAGSFLRSTAERLGTYSYGSDSFAALSGDPCGMASMLRAEPDPRAGLLAPAPAPGTPVLDGFAPTPSAPGPPSTPSSPAALLSPVALPSAPGGTVPAAVPLDIAGTPLPGWATATGGTLTSGWYRVPDEARARTTPVVVTVSGSTTGRAVVRLEFASSPTAAPVAVDPAGDTVGGATSGTGALGGTAPRDLRALAPADATLVRVVATDVPRDAATAAAASPGGTDPGVPLAVSVPRVPRTVPFDDVVPRGSDVLVDWPVAFPFPCVRPTALADGTAGVPSWRLTPPGRSDAGEIEVSAQTGGPFLLPRMLVDEVHVPVYLDGDPERDAVGLVRWVPRVPLATLTPTVGDETVPGWRRTGRATVPVLDTP